MSTLLSFEYVCNISDKRAYSTTSVFTLPTKVYSSFPFDFLISIFAIKNKETPNE